MGIKMRIKSVGKGCPFPLGRKIFEFCTFLDAFSEHVLKVFWVIYQIKVHNIMFLSR